MGLDNRSEGFEGMTQKLKVLDLFSGIGGFSLGLERTGGFETVAFCEIEEFPRKVLAKHWPDVPCFEDVRTLRAEDVGTVDVICGGYPCQPFSTAGKRLGAEDDRHLWPEFNRLVAELQPSWVIGENVAGHISMGLDAVLSDLEDQDYACRTFVIPACAVDAKHRRDRCWTIGYSDSDSKPVGAINAETQELPSMVNATSVRARRETDTRKSFEPDETSTGVEQGRHERSREALADVPQQRSNARRQSQREEPQYTRIGVNGKNVASDPNGKRGCSKNAAGKDAKNAWQSSRGEGENRSRVGIWKTEPDVGRVAHGVPRRVDRLKALGNAVVPQIPEMIGYAILEAEKTRDAPLTETTPPQPLGNG